MRPSATVPFALALALGTTLPAPGHATPGVVVLDCTLTYERYGAGPGQGIGTCTATGAHNGVATLIFSTNDPAAVCPGTGTMAHVGTSPAGGNPCWVMNVTAHAVFTIPGS